MDIILVSIVTCRCGHQREEQMPESSCQIIYQCEACGTVLKPKPGDCCVFCSYGSAACPPVQCDRACHAG